MQDHVLIDEMAHFDRERIPERVVHAKGAGKLNFMLILENVHHSDFTYFLFKTKIWFPTFIFLKFITIKMNFKDYNNVAKN